MENSTPTTLYHYTTMSTLYAILSNIEHKADGDATLDDISFYNIKLRATHYKYLNDPTEYKFLVNCITQGLKEYELQKNVDCAVSDRYSNVSNLITDYIESPSVISLSQHRNDLSMWRSYGGDGLGVAIGFNLCKIKEVLSDCRFGKCEYVTEDEAISKLSTNNHIKEIYELLKDRKNEIDIRLLTFQRQFCPFVKNKCYSNEEEWRIVVSNHLDYKFIERRGLIVPYNEVIIPMSCIDEIVIGPCADKELSEYSLGLMLQRNISTDLGSKIKTETSDIPYINTK